MLPQITNGVGPVSFIPCYFSIIGFLLVYAASNSKQHVKNQGHGISRGGVLFRCMYVEGQGGLII